MPIDGQVAIWRDGQWVTGEAESLYVAVRRSAAILKAWQPLHPDCEYVDSEHCKDAGRLIERWG